MLQLDIGDASTISVTFVFIEAFFDLKFTSINVIDNFL